MTYLYTQNLNGSKNAIDRSLDQFMTGSHDALRAREELALTKCVLADRVGVYAAAKDISNSQSALIAGDMMADCAEKVIGLIEKVSKIEQSQSETVTREQLLVLARQIRDMLFQKAEQAIGTTIDIMEFTGEAVNGIEVMIGIGNVDSQMQEKELLACMHGSIPDANPPPQPKTLEVE